MTSARNAFLGAGVRETVQVTNDPLYFEDLKVGRTFESGSFRIEAEAIKSFATDFDPQPFHLDEECAAGGFFGGLVASGWHVAALTMRRLVIEGLPIAGGLVGAGAELKWVRPTRPGEVLRVVSEIVEVLASERRSSIGIVVIRSETRNRSDEPVQIMLTRLVVPRRDASSEMRDRHRT